MWSCFQSPLMKFLSQIFTQNHQLKKKKKKKIMFKWKFKVKYYSLELGALENMLLQYIYIVPQLDRYIYRCMHGISTMTYLTAITFSNMFSGYV